MARLYAPDAVSVEAMDMGNGHETWAIFDPCTQLPKVG